MCNYSYNFGLGALELPPVHAGAPFSLGVELAGAWNINDLFVDTDLIRRALDASGYVQPGVQVYQQAGIINPFVVVSGRSGREYGSAAHLKDAIISVMQGFNTLNLETLKFQADTYNFETGAASTTASSNAASGAGVLDQAGAAVGNLFNVNPSTGLLIGAVGALALVLILKR